MHLASAVVVDAQVLLIEGCDCTAAVISETGAGYTGQSFEWFVHVASAVVADAQVLLVVCCDCNLRTTVGCKAR